MAKKLFLKLQEPTIEIPLIVSANGITVTSYVGFRCYELTKAEEMIEKLSVIERSEELTKYLVEYNALKDKSDLSINQNMETLLQTEQSLVTVVGKITALRKETANAVSDFVKSEILYLKNVPFVMYDEDENGNLSNPEDFLVKDTREISSTDFWESKQACLSFCIEKMFGSAAWSNKVKHLYMQSLLNIDQVEADKVKN